MLYRMRAAGISLDELAAAPRVDRKDHLRARLRRLGQAKLVLEHPLSGRFYITHRGTRDVETRGLARPYA